MAALIAVIDVWTWVGAGVIFAASLYNAHREGRIRRATPTEEPYSAGPDSIGSVKLER